MSAYSKPKSLVKKSFSSHTRSANMDLRTRVSDRTLVSTV